MAGFGVTRTGERRAWPRTVINGNIRHLLLILINNLVEGINGQQGNLLKAIGRLREIEGLRSL